MEKFEPSYEKEKKRNRSYKKKSENLMGFCLHTLINLCEDILIEMKCVRKGIIDLLVRLLERTNNDLLLYVVFLYL